MCAHDKKDSSLYLPQVCPIVRTEAMTQRDRYFEFKLANGDLGHKPGQFAELSIPGIGEAPISLSSSPPRNGTFEMVIRNVGKVTSMIHTLKAGETLGLRGPFGTDFPMEDLRGKDLLFVAGGIGLVPLRSAIQYALDNRKNYGAIYILFGCTDPTQRLFTKEIADWAKREDIVFLESVDRPAPGWTGNTGVITTLFPKIKDKLNTKNTRALIVGPPIMYKFVILELKTMGFEDKDIIMSLERHMKCGVGKCGHCQINGCYVCQDGPVFTLEAVRGLMEAI